MVDRPLPPDLEPLIKSAINVARRRLEAGNELPGIAFVDAPGVVANPDAYLNHLLEEGMIIVPMVAMPNKDAWAFVIRKLSAMVKARFVMVVSEVWLNDGPNIKAMRDKHGHDFSISDLPDSWEALFVSVETHHGMWAGHAKVVPAPHLTPRTPNEPARTFGEIKLEMDLLSEGRLVGLLGSRGKAN